MPKILPNQFTRVEFSSDEEEDSAKTFSDLNRLYLISLRGDIAHKKLALSVLDPTKIVEFVQAQAFVDGQLEILNHLIGD